MSLYYTNIKKELQDRLEKLDTEINKRERVGVSSHTLLAYRAGVLDAITAVGQIETKVEKDGGFYF